MEIVLHLTIILAFSLFAWAYFISRPTKEEKKHEADTIVTKMVGDYWDMLQEIRRAGSKAELEAWYYEVEQFDSSYSGLIDIKLLHERSLSLYEAIMERRDELNMIKNFS